MTGRRSWAFCCLLSTGLAMAAIGLSNSGGRKSTMTTVATVANHRISECEVRSTAWNEPTQRSDDWPAFLGPTGDGKSTESGILTDWTDGKLKIVWKASTGEGYGMGSVADGRFFHFGRIDGKAKLLCLNAATGRQEWEYSYASNYQDMYGYDSGPRASPLVHEGKVYIYGVEGMLHCLETSTGNLVWKLNMNERFGVIQNFFGVASSPIIYQDLLLVMVGGSPKESKRIPRGALNLVEPNGTGVVALDKETGQVRYQVVNDLASYCSLKLASINNQDVLLAWMRGALFGFEPKTGKQQFEFPWRSRKLESVNASTPVVMDDHVFISECYELGSALLKLDNLKPNLVWSDKGKRDKALEAHWNTPIVIGDFLYGCSGRNPGPAELRCVRWKTGEVMWKEPGLARTSLTYIDGYLIVMGEEGDLLLIEATSEKFNEVTRYEPGQGNNAVRFRRPCWAAPIVADGLMYVRGKDQLVCFRLAEGKD